MLSLLILSTCYFCFSATQENEQSDCYEVVNAGSRKIRYTGKGNVTQTGRECQRWDSQRPHFHKKKPKNFPNKDLSGNFCRDPDNKGFPWCFTTDPTKKREQCSIPDCKLLQAARDLGKLKECYKIKHIPSTNTYNVLYGGNVSDTIRGIPCQKWTGQEPNKHDRTPENFPYKGLGDHNNCRDPDETGYPWCYTTQPGVRWEGCSVPQCHEEVIEDACEDIECPSIAEDCTVSHEDEQCCPTCSEDCRNRNIPGYSYYNITDTWHTELCLSCTCYLVDGKKLEVCSEETCRYSSHCYKSTYVTDQCCAMCGDSRYEETEYEVDLLKGRADSIIRTIDETENINCQYIREGETRNNYRGQANVTARGVTCQRWSATSPHYHAKQPAMYPSAGLGEHNFCRDPDGNGKLWCYTIDPDTRFGFCDIPICSTDELRKLKLCEKLDCGKGGDCYISRSGQTACRCKSGFIGINKMCADIDECKHQALVCEDDLAKCINTEGAFECLCPEDHYWNNEGCVNASYTPVSIIPDGAECHVPEFVKKPRSRYEATIGNDVIIECEGEISDTVYWTKGLDGEEIIDTRKMRSSTLKLLEITKNDIHIYRCVLLNDCTGFTKVANIDIHAKVVPCIAPELQKFGMVWDKKDFYSAYQFCLSFGLSFAAPRTASESDVFIQDVWKSYHLDPNGKKFRDTTWIWIAATDRIKENSFTDIDGQPINPTKWWHGYPDNRIEIDPAGEDEVAYHLYSGAWDDSYWFIPRPFACQCSD